MARAAEFEALAEQARATDRHRALMKERISLLRRDVSKLVGLGLDEGLPGDWEDYRLRAMALMTPLRRVRCDRAMAALEADLASLRAEALKALESRADVRETMSSAHHPMRTNLIQIPNGKKILNLLPRKKGPRARLLTTERRSPSRGRRRNRFRWAW